MPLFRKKPVVVEAVQFDGTNHGECKAFYGPAFSHLSIVCGDWIIKDGDGLVSIRTDATFRCTYEPADSPDREEKIKRLVEAIRKVQFLVSGGSSLRYSKEGIYKKLDSALSEYEKTGEATTP